LFDGLDFDFLTCGYYEFNSQSKRVQEKCGFKPYRKLEMDTRMGTKEKGILNLLLNPKKRIELNFSHPETLIYNSETYGD
jgi:ribosomal-protein-alanine N-acetyltransferase